MQINANKFKKKNVQKKWVKNEQKESAAYWPRDFFAFFLFAGGVYFGRENNEGREP